MLGFLFFLPFFLVNLGLLIFILRWRGLYSFEGLGAAYLIMTITTDWLGKVFQGLQAADIIYMDTSFYPAIVPTIVHIIGISSLLLGLYISDPKPEKVNRAVDEATQKMLVKLGIAFAVLGILMKIVALYSAGITSITAYFLSMSIYVTAERNIGGFLDLGTGIASFGLTLVAIFQKTIFRQLVLFLVSLGFLFLLSYSRGGVIGGVISFCFMLWALNRSSFKKWSNWKIVLPIIFFLIPVVLITSGIKSKLRTGHLETETDSSDYFKIGLDRFYSRFGGEEGLYDGYINFVNNINAQPGRFLQGGYLGYALTSWTPKFLYADKPIHPSRAIGDLVYHDRVPSMQDVSALMMVGTSYFDFGIYSTVGYLFIVGLLNGAIRRFVLNRKQLSAVLFLWYLYYANFGGDFIHAGIAPVVENIVLTSSLVFIAYVMVCGYQKTVQVLTIISLPKAQNETKPL